MTIMRSAPTDCPKLIVNAQQLKLPTRERRYPLAENLSLHLDASIGLAVVNDRQYASFHHRFHL